MLRDALRIGSVSGLSLQRTRCYRAVVVILSVTHEVRRFRLRTKSSRRWHALWVLVAFLLPQPVHATLHVVVLDKQEIAKSDQVGTEIGFHVQRFGRDRNGDG